MTTKADVRIRQSTIGSWLLCPARVGLSQDDGFDRTPSEAMAFGSLVHAIIEEFYVSHPDVWPLALFHLDVVRRMLDLLAEKDGWVPSDVADEAQLHALCLEAMEAAQRWHAQVYVPVLKDLEVVAIEERVELPLGRGVTLEGTPDLVTTVGVFDWKTAGRGWSLNRSNLSKGSYGAQAPLYLHMVREHHGLDLLNFTFVVYDRSKGEWSLFPTTWSDAAIRASVALAEEVGLSVEAGAFPYRPYTEVFGKAERGWWCSPKYCGAWDICVGKHGLADGYDTEALRDRRW